MNNCRDGEGHVVPQLSQTGRHFPCVVVVKSIQLRFSQRLLVGRISRIHRVVREARHMEASGTPAHVTLPSAAAVAYVALLL